MRDLGESKRYLESQNISMKVVFFHGLESEGPSLIQMKKGKKKWMVSRPYAFPEDLKNKDVTTATDVYAFDCFKKWFIGV